MKPSPWAWGIVAVGAAAVVTGAALIYVPAAVILAGFFLGAFGMFAFEFEVKK